MRGSRFEARGPRQKAKDRNKALVRGKGPKDTEGKMNFEDLEVWKRSARLSADIYKELRSLKDFGFKDQITRSGLSVPSNISEGFERESDRDCMKFLL